MRRANSLHNLRLSDVREYSAGGFTLVELMVSIGLLALMMGLAGTIFALTLESSGQANALIEVKQSIRAFEHTLREDVLNIDPRESMLIVQGNIVRAYPTQDDMDADTDTDPLTGFPIARDPEREMIHPTSADHVPEMPRADMLMFFTNRVGESYVDRRVKGRKQQVVYGHAEIGELAENGTWVAGVPPMDVKQGTENPYAYVSSQFDPAESFDLTDLPDTDEVPAYPVPARQWHLARRSVLIVDRSFPSDYYPLTDLDDLHLTGKDDDPRYLSLSIDKKYWIVDGRRDFVVNDEEGDFGYGRDVAFDLPDSVPPVMPSTAFADVRAVQLDTPGNPQGLKIPWFARSQMDLRPSPKVADRLGHYMLKNCSGFKVEWRLDPQAADDPNDLREYERYIGGLIWVDPTDPAKTRAEIQEWVDWVKDNNPDPLVGQELQMRLSPVLTQLNPGSSSSRFNRGEVGANHIFYSRIIEHPANGVAVPDSYFPTALRITIDVYDSANRLERPIRHVMVLPIGEG